MQQIFRRSVISVKLLCNFAYSCFIYLRQLLCRFFICFAYFASRILLSSEIYKQKPKITALFRSSHQKCSIKKGVLKNFTKFKGKHLCQSLFFNKVADFRPSTLLKKRLWRRCFSVNFLKFVRIPFLQSTSGRLFLSIVFKDTHRETATSKKVLI